MSLAEKSRAPVDVLIAEDDGDVRLAVRQLLEEQGYTCAEAEDGRVAVEAARRCPPRLVLLDLMMPEVDGFTAARQLRSDPVTRDVRIHCVTALNFTAAAHAAREVGCDGFLAKPFSSEDLLEAVRTGVQRLRPGDDELAQGVERLERTLAAPTPGRERSWAKQVAGALENLADTLRRQISRSRTADGPFERVDLSRATLARQAGLLRQQQYRQLGEIRSLLAQVESAADAFQAPLAGTSPDWPQPGPAGPVVDFHNLRYAGERLASSLKRQAAAERELLFESLNTDIGGGD